MIINQTKQVTYMFKSFKYNVINLLQWKRKSENNF